MDSTPEKNETSKLYGYDRVKAGLSPTHATDFYTLQRSIELERGYPILLPLQPNRLLALRAGTAIVGITSALA